MSVMDENRLSGQEGKVVTGVFEPDRRAVEPRATTVAMQAEALVYGDRAKAYGHPKEEFAKVAAMWSVITGHEIKPEHVPLMMIGLKIVREVKKPKEDNLVDICGYALTAEMQRGDRGV